MTFVYRVTNQVNGKVYFGKAVDVDARWYKHCWDARHTRKAFPFLRAIRKYGPDAFVVETLAAFDSDAAAGGEEIRCIAASCRARCYNVAAGGTGGHTMAATQLEAQYAIGSKRYAEFARLFDEGYTTQQLREHFGVSLNAVESCAKRLGLSFAARRRWQATLAEIRNLAGLSTKPRRRYYTYQKLPDDVRRRIHSETASRVNRSRGPSVATQRTVLELYFDDNLSAREVAARLGISRGAVRGIVNRANAGTLNPAVSWTRRGVEPTACATETS